MIISAFLRLHYSPQFLSIIPIDNAFQVDLYRVECDIVRLG